MMVKQFKDRERQMREYAKALYHVSEIMNDERNRYAPNHECVVTEYHALVKEIVVNGFSADTILAYMEQYKTMTFEEHKHFYYEEE